MINNKKIILVVLFLVLKVDVIFNKPGVGLLKVYLENLAKRVHLNRDFESLSKYSSGKEYAQKMDAFIEKKRKLDTFLRESELMNDADHEEYLKENQRYCCEGCVFFSCYDNNIFIFSEERKKLLAYDALLGIIEKNAMHKNFLSRSIRRVFNCEDQLYKNENILVSEIFSGMINDLDFDIMNMNNILAHSKDFLNKNRKKDDVK